MIENSYISGGYLVVDTAEKTHLIPLDQPANYCALLGYENIVDAIDAIVKIGEYETDTSDIEGESIWTPCMVMLCHLETIREEEAEKAQQQGKADDPRSPLLRSTIAVRSEIRRLSNGENCLTSLQRQAREALKVPDFPQSGTFTALRHTIRCTVEAQCQQPEGQEACLDSADRQRIIDTLDAGEDQAGGHLAAVMDWMNQRKRGYAHMLTGRQHDPLGDPEDAPEPPKTTLNTVAERLGIDRDITI